MYKAHAIFFYTLYIKQRIRYPYFSTGPTLEFSIWVGCHIHMGISASLFLHYHLIISPQGLSLFAHTSWVYEVLTAFSISFWKIGTNELFSDTWYQTCSRKRQTILQMRLSPVHHCAPTFLISH